MFWGFQRTDGDSTKEDLLSVVVEHFDHVWVAEDVLVAQPPRLLPSLRKETSCVDK
jgi:mannitol-1-phosphate/altronate dehydrogenase